MSTCASFQIEHLQYLDAEGKLRAAAPPLARDFEQLVALYRQMLFVRVFDAKSVALQRTGKLGTYASCLGHEAVHGAGKTRRSRRRSGTPRAGATLCVFPHRDSP